MGEKGKRVHAATDDGHTSGPMRGALGSETASARNLLHGEEEGRRQPRECRRSDQPAAMDVKGPGCTESRGEAMVGDDSLDVSRPMESGPTQSHGKGAHSSQAQPSEKLMSLSFNFLYYL